MTDLTKITTPFGLLDEETQQALKEAYYSKGCEIQHFNWGGWQSGVPGFHPVLTYRVKPVELTDMVVPWAAINPEYKWAAMDANTSIWLFPEKPTKYEYKWTGGGCVEGSIFKITPGTKPWDQSLVQRPEGV